MESPLKIYTEQLKEGKREEIRHVLTPDFLEIQEEELIFKSPIHVEGEAYIIDNLLIFQLSTHTEAKMPCSICNQMTFVPLKADNICHTLELQEFPATGFDYTQLLREEILLLIPQFVECHAGKCPHRTDVAKFMKGKNLSTNTHFPFSNL